jgi:hypothetical protein
VTIADVLAATSGVKLNLPSLVFSLACFIGVIWTVVDVAKQPTLTRRQKAMWLPGLIFGFFIIKLVGLVAAVFYFIAVRPRLLARISR